MTAAPALAVVPAPPRPTPPTAPGRPDAPPAAAWPAADRGARPRAPWAAVARAQASFAMPCDPLTPQRPPRALHPVPLPLPLPPTTPAITAPASADVPPSRSVSVAPLPTSVDDLLASARHGIAEAATASSPPERYAAAHLSALRAAAAVIAARARPESHAGRRVRPLSAWVLLAAVAPELAEWAAFFASGARKRAAAEAGLPGSVTAREADDLLRDAETFLAVVETKLGGAPRPTLLDRGVG